MHALICRLGLIGIGIFTVFGCGNSLPEMGPETPGDGIRTYDDAGIPAEDPDAGSQMTGPAEDGGMEPIEMNDPPPQTNPETDPMDPMGTEMTDPPPPPPEPPKMAFACPARTEDTLEEDEVWVGEGIIDEDTTFVAGRRYYLQYTLLVAGAALTLEAGTTLCLGPDAALMVGSEAAGTIDVQGTLDLPVTITSIEGESGPGGHGGLLLNRFVGSAISHLDIWYGGRWFGDPLVSFLMTEQGAVDGPLYIDHLTIGESNGPAFAIFSPEGFTEDSVIQILGARGGFEAPVREAEVRLLPPLPIGFLNAYAATNATPTSLAIDFERVPEEHRSVRLFLPESTVLARDSELHDLGAPFVILSNVIVRSVTWTIGAGTTLVMMGTIFVDAFDPKARLDEGGLEPIRGNLVIAGTEEKPVVLRGQSDDPGSWGGIYFRKGGFDPEVSSLSHVEILSAGKNDGFVVLTCGEPAFGAILIEGTGAFEGPQMDAVTIRDSGSLCLASSHDDSTVQTELATDYTDAIACENPAITADACEDVGMSQREPQ